MECKRLDFYAVSCVCIFTYEINDTPMPCDACLYEAVMPPSTRVTEPSMYDALELETNVMTSAISCGVAFLFSKIGSTVGPSLGIAAVSGVLLQR